MSNHASTKAMVQFILENADKFKWSLQGFGMLRLYLPNDTRLHVWDSRFAVPNVSLIHDHPWSFRSDVVVGKVHNKKFVRRPSTHADNYMVKEIQPGEGTFDRSHAESCFLDNTSSSLFTEGDYYLQESDEIHSSHPVDGTVTLVKRYRGDVDAARVFWPIGEDWVSGEPRPATPAEVEAIVTYSLNTWFRQDKTKAAT